MDKMIPFIKMHGLGNDFVIVRQQDLNVELSKAQIQHISNRHIGVGCDQFILLSPSDDADIYMTIYNPDGSQAEACGNATRCVAELVYRDTGKEKEIKIKTVAGILIANRIESQIYSVDMGVPEVFELEGLEDVKAQFHLPQPIGVSIGNPHAVFFMEYEPNDGTLTKMGRVIEHHPTFPNRTNVEFAVLQADGSIRMRVWERSAGITQACGSAACATAASSIALGRHKYGDNIVLKLDGGDLTLNWPAKDKGMIMTGAVAESFRGHLDLSLFT